MIKLALIGRDISHSQSPKLYRRLLAEDIDYSLLDYPQEADIPSLHHLMAKFHGISITSPYKKYFLGQVELDEAAQKTGAINCLYQDQGIVRGTNTDFLALRVILNRQRKEYGIDEWVLFGDGVMTKVVGIIAQEMGMPYKILNRQNTGDLGRLDLTQTQFHHRIGVINCCSRSMLFEGKLPDETFFFDLNYGLLHPFLFTEHSYSFEDGHELLKLQGIFASQCWKLLPAKNS